MADLLFPNFLSSDETYDRCTEFWRALVDEIEKSRGQADTWSRWLPEFYGDGVTPLDDRDGNPIVHVMTHWFAPFTGGNRATLPAGTVVVARHDQHSSAPGFNWVPEDYDRLEPLLVPDTDRFDEKYSGYSLSFVLDDIGITIEEIDPEAGR